MDNNQNNMFNSQPVNNQPVQPEQQANPFGQQPQQQANPFGQQQGQQGNPFGQQPQQAGQFGQQPQQSGSPFGSQYAPKKPVNVSYGLIALICGGVSLVMAIIGSIFACTCSASKSWSVDNMAGSLLSTLGGSSSFDIHTTSAVIIVNIIAAIIAIAAIVLAIMNLKKNADDKMSKIAIALGAFAFLYAILPVLTICGYNCSLNKNMSSSL